MADEHYVFSPIGRVQSPFQEPVGVPIQPSAGAGVKGQVVLDPAFREGLQDLEGFSHIILIYIFHQAGEGGLLVKPFLDDQVHGVFATRAPQRPNKIGISVVKLVGIEDCILDIENLDILDGTPVLDIKPYVSDFDPGGDVRVGWLTDRLDQLPGKQADDRFTP